MIDYLLEMKDVHKEFTGVKALKGVDLRVKEGEIHCLMGENGAGKSTLIKILAGVFKKDSGQIIFDGKEVTIDNPNYALKLGISFIHQELSTVTTLTVEENITLGTESISCGIVNKKENIRRVSKILSDLNIDINPKELVKNLTVSQKQMMMIAKALSQKVKLIVMDEPTASLTCEEAKKLFDMMYKLKERGITFIYISHRFEDIFTIGDRITVLRDGEFAGIVNVIDTTENELIKLMVGRNLDETYPNVDKTIEEEVLRVENLTTEKLLKNISFSLHRGEILGVSGLAGAGKSELAEALFGANKKLSGHIYLKDQEIEINNPKEAIKNGIALVPEERRTQGIIAKMTVRENISLASSNKISRSGIVNKKLDKEIAEKYVNDLKIKTPGIEQQIQFLSGGNQQKVIIGKWLNTDADIILLDEPTRGIDIGAKYEIYNLINNLAKSKKAVIMFSSEMPELIGMCDNIVVMSEGKVTGVLPKGQLDQEEIMKLSVIQET